MLQITLLMIYCLTLSLPTETHLPVHLSSLPSRLLSPFFKRLECVFVTHILGHKVCCG